MSLIRSLFVVALAGLLSSCANYKGVFAEASPAPGTKVNWPGKAFSSVKAYCYDYTAESDGSFLVNGRMHSGVMDPKGVRLTAEQTSRLMKMITVSQPRQKRSSCYRPHHAFVFYDARGGVAAVLEMCFGCNKFVATPGGLPEYFDTTGLYGLCSELGLPLGQGNAFYRDACRSGRASARN